MKIHRFFGDFVLFKTEVNKEINIDDSELINQIKNVLKLKTGEFMILCDGNKEEAKVEIENMNPKEIRVKVLEKYENTNEPKIFATLYCSILKKENFELVAQKAVEVGISKIVPVLCERTVKTGINISRLEKIIKEASEQSARGVLPVLGEVVDFKQVLNQIDKKDLNLIFDSSGENFNDIKKENSISNISLFIGPEGGFTENELKLALESGVQKLSLGKITLRAETAVIVASYLVSNFRE